MRKILFLKNIKFLDMRSKIYLIAFIFTCFQLNAQTYTWQWAKTGGGTNGSFGIGFSHRQDEHILDMVVDNQNNTYYLVALYDGTPLLDGQPVTNYGSKDILLFSKRLFQVSPLFGLLIRILY